MFQKMTNALTDIHFPLKKISVSPYDKAWITEELKTLRRRRQRIYRKEGNSQNYLDIKKEFDSKQKVEVSRYIDKIKQEVLSGKRGSGYNAIRKLGNREFEANKGSEYFDNSQPKPLQIISQLLVKSLFQLMLRTSLLTLKMNV